MEKKIKIWNAKTLNGEESSKKAGTMKSLCSKLGISYNTAKKRQDMDGKATTWLIGNIAWEVWVEFVDR